MSEYRDKELGDALRDLGRAEHSDEFFTRLWAEAKRDDAAEVGDVAGAKAPSPAQRSRWWARPRARLAGLAAAAVVAALIVAVALFGLPGTKGAGPAIATAAEVLASMDHAGETPMTVTADIVTTYFGPDGKPDDALSFRRHIVFDTRGDWLRTLVLVSDPAGEVEGVLFDAKALEYGEWRAPKDWDGSSSVRGGLVTGVPASYGFQRRYSDLDTVSLIRSIVAGSDAPAESVTYDARDAWHLDIEVPPLADWWPDRVELTVDKETGFPLRTVELRNGARQVEDRVVEFKVVASGSADELSTLETVRNAIVNPYDSPEERAFHDYGCRRAPLEGFVELIGRPAIVAGSMPDGFAFADATAKTGTGFSNDPETSVVYRGGLWSFAVDSFQIDELGVSGDEGGVIEDPIGQSSGLDDEVVTLTRGLFKGMEAHIVIDAQTRFTAPHLWLRDEQRGIAVVVLGDLSRDDFLAVAESLEEGPK